IGNLADCANTEIIATWNDSRAGLRNYARMGTFNSCGSATPTPTATPSDARICSWESVAPYFIPVEGAAVTSDGTYVYSFGGGTNNGGAPTDLAQRYDPGTDSWVSLEPLPIPLSRARATYAAATNKIYLFGGRDAFFDTLYTLYVYDIASNS